KRRFLLRLGDHCQGAACCFRKADDRRVAWHIDPIGTLSERHSTSCRVFLVRRHNDPQPLILTRPCDIKLAIVAPLDKASRRSSWFGITRKKGFVRVFAAIDPVL